MTGAARLEISMNGWALLEARERAPSELKQLLQAAGRVAFGAEPAELHYSEEADMRMASVAFTAGHLHIEANVQALHEVTYLVATVRSGKAGVGELGHVLASFFRAADVTPTVTACVVGIVSGRLSPAEALELVGTVLRVLAADMLDFYSDRGVVNLTAYSRLLPAPLSLALGGRKTNLSLSMRFNEQADTTWVWLSWPTCAAII